MHVCTQRMWLVEPAVYDASSILLPLLYFYYFVLSYVKYIRMQLIYGTMVNL